LFIFKNNFVLTLSSSLDFDVNCLVRCVLSAGTVALVLMTAPNDVKLARTPESVRIVQLSAASPCQDCSAQCH
jgi:hypothetical protein